MNEPTAGPILPDNYKTILEKYRTPTVSRSLFQLLSTLVGFVALWILMWYCLGISYGITLLLAIPTGGLLIRMFILQHDCGHRSFFKSQAANDVVGTLLGMLTFTPYHAWRRFHNMHHASSGDLDRRGHGDVKLLTVAEYQKLSPLRKLGYRIYRHPMFLFIVSAFVYFFILQRFASAVPRSWTKERANIRWTNVGILVSFLVMMRLVGVVPFLMIHLPIAAFAASIGIWLFYVQHNFEGTYWKAHESWDFVDAGMHGSSYFHLPKVLQWFTANIGLHHIHHLDSRIPNYRLPACMSDNAEFQPINRLTLRSSLDCISLKLWDESSERMTGFPRPEQNGAPAGGTAVEPPRTGRPQVAEPMRVGVSGD